MYQYVISSLLLLAIVGLHMTSAAPHQDRNRHNTHHKHKETSMREVEEILNVVGDDARIIVDEGDVTSEIVIPPTPLPKAEEDNQQKNLRNRRRRRRSAALLLHAALRLCDSRPARCRDIILETREGRVSAKFRIADQ